MYVGYGREVSRSISHRGHSHNEELKSWLERNPFDLQIAGPYRDEEEAKNVESALISGLNPRFNRSPGEGPAFAPLGVPPHLSERTQQPALRLSQIGKMTGGALLVYLAPGLFLPDGRRSSMRRSLLMKMPSRTSKEAGTSRRYFPDGTATPPAPHTFSLVFTVNQSTDLSLPHLRLIGTNLDKTGMRLRALDGLDEDGNSAS